MEEKHLKNSGSSALIQWNRFIAHGEMENSGVNPVIGRSWQRSRGYKIDPYAAQERSVLTHAELREKIEQTWQLVKAATPVMEDLFQLLRGLGFMVLLADADGHVIKTILDDDFRRQAREVLLCEGANWSERVKGTNAIGTSLVEREPVKVFAYEHYVQDNHALACAAIPIFGAGGELLGALDVTGESRRGNSRIFRMVKMAARNIERELHLLHVQKHLNMYKAKYNGIFELMKEGAVVVDESGVVREVSQTAGQVLGVRPEECVGENIEGILNLNNVWVLDPSSGESREITLCAKNGADPFKARARRIFGPDGRPEGLVALVSPTGSVQGGEKDHRQLSAVGNTAKFTFDQIIGRSGNLSQVISICKRVARNNSTVLLTGETGTGKEMLAQAIHQGSARSNGPFVAVNCAAIPAQLVESELFGYEDGAFTGARKGGCPGKFELAHGGTIFLDEIGDMPMSAQVSLLRVLQEKQLCRVGGRQTRRIDVRVIAATHRNLSEMAEEGSFRQDLYFRLNVVNINIPSLRVRKDDIELLAMFFLDKYKTLMNRPNLAIDSEAAGFFRAYSWPGNVRELENVIEGLVNVVEGELITPSHLPAAMIQPPTATLEEQPVTLRDMEKAAIRQAIIDCGGSLSAAAVRIDIGRSTLYRKIKEYDIDVEALLK